MVRNLLGGVIKRTRRQLLKARTVRTGAGRRLRLNQRALPIAKGERGRLRSVLERFGAARGEPRFYRLLDAARRVAGKGSLGLERYVLLVEGKGSPRGNYLLDLKRATAQTAALANEITAASVSTRRMTASVLLIKALGGGWTTADLPVAAALRR
jgi:uncharacterized protein (DUF2252 family)